VVEEGRNIAGLRLEKSEKNAEWRSSHENPKY